MATPASTLTAEQQALRSGRFTSTKIVDLVEGRALKVFNDWFGYSPPFKDSARPRWGRRLERVIIDAAAEEQGWSKVTFPGTVIDPDDDLFATTADFVADDEIAGDAKNRGSDQAHLYANAEAQTKEIVQVTVHCGVLKKPRGVVAALLGGNDLRVIPVPFDPETWEGIKEMCHRFKRDHLDTGRPPPMDASDAASEYLRARFPVHRAPMLTADATLEEWAAELRHLRGERDSYEALTTEMENRIKATLGDAEGVQGTFGRLSWKATKPVRRVDWQAVAEALKAPPDVIAAHTEEKPGARRFLCTWSKP